MGTGRVTIAGIQFAGIAEEKERNIGVATRLIREAATQGAQIAMTPEVVLTGFVGGQRERKMAEPIPGPACAHFAALAKELGVVLPISFFEKTGQAHFNSLVMIDADGALMGTYRKSHIPDGPGYEEKFYFSPGDSGFRVWQTAMGTIGVGIC